MALNCLFFHSKAKDMQIVAYTQKDGVTTFYITPAYAGGDVVTLSTERCKSELEEQCRYFESPREAQMYAWNLFYGE